MKVPLRLLLPDGYLETSICYFIMVLSGGVLQPVTFPLFRKIRAEKTRQADAARLPDALRRDR
ncbi:MAG: hypothetical protein J6X30_00860 [Clostridia bacterium]|nr:hypothetical protein [Clostridia bacterium]